jgi:hypothetical protein
MAASKDHPNPPDRFFGTCRHCLKYVDLVDGRWRAVDDHEHEPDRVERVLWADPDPDCVLWVEPGVSPITGLPMPADKDRRADTIKLITGRLGIEEIK